MPKSTLRAPAPPGRRHSRLYSVFHAVASSLDDHGVSVVQQPVEDGGSKGGVVVEDLRPVLEGPVGSNYQSALLIAQTDHLEQQVGAGLVDGQKAQLVQDEQRGPGVFFKFLFHAPYGLGHSQGVDHIDGGGKKHRVSFQASVIPRRQPNETSPTRRRPERSHWICRRQT